MSRPIGGIEVTPLGLIARTDHSLSKERSHEALREQAEQLEEHAGGVLSAIQTARVDRHLTGPGKSARVAEIRAEAEASEFWSRETERVEAVRAKAAERRATLLSRSGGWLTPKDMSEERADELAREVRDRLETRRASMDEAEFRRYVRGVAEEAARSDDRLVLRAIETAPLALLPEEELDEVRELHSRSLAPDRWESADELAALADLLGGNLRRALIELRTRGDVWVEV